MKRTRTLATCVGGLWKIQLRAFSRWPQRVKVVPEELTAARAVAATVLGDRAVDLAVRVAHGGLAARGEAIELAALVLHNSKLQRLAVV